MCKCNWVCIAPTNYRKRLKPELTDGEIPETSYGLSDKDLIDSEIFEDWFERHVLAHVPPVRPLMLLLNGHSSHYQPSVVHKAAENDIVLFCLPPHTTYLAQPLDRTCFSPLKQAWNEECRLYMATNPGKKVNQYNFTQLFARAWEEAMIYTKLYCFRISRYRYMPIQQKCHQDSWC